MLARNALVFGSIAIASFLLACGAPPDGTGKDGKHVGGSPNDPGWVPPGQNNGPSPDDGNPQPGDDQGEQPTGNPNGCTPPAMPAPMDGWTMHTMHHFAVDAPSFLPAGGFDDHSDAPSPDRFAFLDLHKKLAVGAGWSLSVTEDLVSGDPASAMASMKAAFDKAHDASCTATFSTTTFKCDPAAVETITCVTPNNTIWGYATVMEVFHAGETFTVTCGGQGVPSPSSLPGMCATFGGSFTITM